MTVYNVTSVWTLATRITRVPQYVKAILSDSQKYSFGTEVSLRTRNLKHLLTSHLQQQQFKISDGQLSEISKSKLSVSNNELGEWLIYRDYEAGAERWLMDHCAWCIL